MLHSRMVAGVTASVFIFTNVLFASLPQQTVWTERSKKESLSFLTVSQPDISRITPADSVAGLPPSMLAHIVVHEQHQGSCRQNIVLLQDVHGDSEAQQNIAQALLALRAQKTPVTIALEGARGGFVYDAFHLCPSPAAAQSALEKLFSAHQISGPAFAGFSAFPKSGLIPLAFVGVDDVLGYQRNVAAYRAGAAHKALAQARLARDTQRVDALKKIYFDAALSAFDRSFTAYRRGELPMSSYIDVLGAHAALPAPLRAFQQAITAESSLDFSRVEFERARVLKQLVERLSKSQRDELIAFSAACQQNQISFGTYYRRFTALCASARIDLNATPALRDYIRYALTADRLAPAEIHRDLEKTERDIYARLARTPEQARLVARSSFLTLAQLLIDFALTSDQWRQYQRLKIKIGVDLSAFESFYAQADIRSDKMVQNLLPLLKKGEQTLVLVVGGFHSDRIKTLLAERGFSYVLASPKITHVSNGPASAYLSAFDREKMPLDQLFFGHKLFLAPPVAGAKAPLEEIGLGSPTIVRRVVEAASSPSSNGTGNGRLQAWAEAVLEDEGSLENPVTTHLDRNAERKRLRAFLSQLQKESARKGSGRVMPIYAISDEHGAIEKMDSLLLRAIETELPKGKIDDDFTLNPDETLEVQFARIGISLTDLKGKIFFMNLGDFMDRGDWGVKVFRRSKELVDAGLSAFVIGNHDFWEMMNLLGYHLPFYKRYRFHKYSDKFDEDSKYGTVSEMLEVVHKEHPETQTPEFWSQKFAEITKNQEDMQRNHWIDLDVLVNGQMVDGKYTYQTGLFSQVKDILAKRRDSKEELLWKKFRGYYFSDVYTGVRAVEQMSLQWWLDLAEEFEGRLRELQDDEKLTADPRWPDFQTAWIDALKIMNDEIIPSRQESLQREMKEGHYWYRFLQAINYSNYSSSQWWAKDWVFHSGWGTRVLKELSRPGAKVTPENYLSNETLKDIAGFFKSNFHLYQRDQYQNTYMHAFLPVDSDGAFYFRYKGRSYRGNGQFGDPSVWEGLDAIAEDVRNNDVSKLEEAFDLVNSWYADLTTEAKVEHVVRALNTHGLDKLLDTNGINVLFTGHLPLQDFAKEEKKRPGSLAKIAGFQTGGRLVFTDGGAAEKFGNQGHIVRVSADGIASVGYASKDATELTDNPGILRPGVKNLPLSREEYLPAVIQRIQDRLSLLEESDQPVMYRSLSNRLWQAALYLVPSTILSAVMPWMEFSWMVFAVSVASALMGMTFLKQAWDIERAVKKTDIADSDEKDVRERVVSYTKNQRVHLKWKIAQHMSLRARVSAVEEELFHLKLDQFKFFQKMHSRMKEVAGNIAHRILQMTTIHLDVVEFLLSGQFDFERPETNFTRAENSDTDPRTFVHAFAVDGLATIREDADGAEGLQLVPWKYKPGSKRGKAIIEALLLGKQSGEILGALRLVALKSGDLIVDMASDENVVHDLFFHFATWIQTSAALNPTQPTDAVVVSDEEERDSVDVTRFLEQVAPKGPLLHESDLENNNIVINYVKTARTMPAAYQEWYGYVLISYLQSQRDKAGQSISELLDERVPASVRQPAVSVYHLNQLGDPGILESELQELEQLIEASKKEEKESGRLSHDVVVALHNTMPLEANEKFGKLIAGNERFVRAVPVDDQLLMEDRHDKDRHVYSYTKLLVRSQERHGPTNNVQRLLKGETGRLETFSKVPAQFMADGVLSKVWTLLVNIGRGWSVMPVERLIGAAKLARVSA